MPKFQVQDMSCQHCEASIKAALKALDPQADIQVDLASHVVTIASSLTSTTLENAIRDAGYTPVLAPST
jgi:copper chaperone